MARRIERVLISTMPRAGTVFLFNFVAELFQYSKLDPIFTGGFKPNPPEWDPYKFDTTYDSLANSQVLCAHYPLSQGVRKLVLQPDVLTIYLYRDPRDAAVSAALFIKNALAHHPLHQCFSALSDSDAIAFMLSGGVLATEDDRSENGCRSIDHEGMKYFCDAALEWLAAPEVAKIRYEDLTTDPVGCLKESFLSVGVEIDETRAQEVARRLDFTSFSEGRRLGEEDVRAHFRKGMAGDFVNYFNGLHRAICKQRIGHHLIALGYEEDLCW